MKAILSLLILSVGALSADANSIAELLTKACRSGDIRTAENLLAAGADPGLPDRYGATPLYYAASFNQTEMVELLLAYHADPNAPVTMNRSTTNPLESASGLGHVRIASLLISAGADVKATSTTGRTALHAALNQVGIMHLLIEKGADVNARDAEGVAPLDNAVWLGSLDAVAILLAHGARLNEIEPRTGATPINEAAYRGHTAVVQYLLQFKPDLEVRDKRGNTPLENAVRMKKEDSALLLLEAEAAEGKPPEFYQKIMDPAVRRDEPALVEALLRHGVSINGALPSGSTPLGTASFASAAKVVSLLLNHNADPNIGGPDGTSPLEDAALKGFNAIAAMLLDHGTRVDQINAASGNTALYTAASFGRTAVVKLLLDRGANPNLCGTNRKSPFRVAKEQGNTDAATLIQLHGGAEDCR